MIEDYDYNDVPPSQNESMEHRGDHDGDDDDIMMREPLKLVDFSCSSPTNQFNNINPSASNANPQTGNNSA